jgi:hypothetical protein
VQGQGTAQRIRVVAYQVMISGTIVKKQAKPKKDKDGKETGESYRSLFVDTGLGEEMVEVDFNQFEQAHEGAPVQVLLNRKLKVWNGTPRFVLEATKVTFKAA